mmetsp:Transcript_7115/g.12234  ORF Transcript_7115/g.12234 Transcript_7115/m.12234 type:complete len:440 (-) Transcript_7115:214-1533(-)
MAHPAAAVYSPDSVLIELTRLQGTRPSPGPCCSHDNLLQSMQIQHEVVQTLKEGTTTAEVAHRALGLYLQAQYKAISSMGSGILAYNQLELSIIKSGMAAPFITDMDTTTNRLSIGLPTTNAVADTLPEVLAIAGAAFVSMWHYLNFRHSPDACPSDDAALLLATLCIRSLELQGSVAARVDSEASALGLEGFGSHELLWLMHWVRAELTGWYSTVQFFTQGKDKCQESLVAQQQDRLVLIKQVPTNALGYVLYCRSCLGFQQHRVAYMFATKGQAVAQAAGDYVFGPQLMCIRALAASLGGAGNDTYCPRESAELLLAARAQLALASAWIPPVLHKHLTLEPEDGAVGEAVLDLLPVRPPGADEAPQAQEETDQDGVGFSSERRLPWQVSEEEAAAAAATAEGQVPVRNALYTTPRPRTLPIGALTQLESVQKQLDAL